MSDRLTRLVASPLGRSVLERIGLPMPAALPRIDGSLSARPLSGRCVHVGGLGQTSELAARLKLLGADVVTRADDERGADGLLFDATSLATASGLDALRSFFGPRLGALSPAARVLVLGATDNEGSSLEARAAQAALVGFVKSLARELGRKGSTANLAQIRGATEDAITPLASFFLAEKSAFVTGQVVMLEAPEGDRSAPTARPFVERTAVVTGAAQGIGRATARALSREGARVLCVDRPAEREALALVVKEVNGVALEADLADQAALPQLADAIAAEGPIDLVIHNAGVTRDRTLARMSEAEWRAVLDVNLRAVVTLTPLLVPHVRDGGRVILLSSVTGLSGNVGQTAYAATKAGLIGLTRALAWSLAPQRITVNAVAPGFIETRLTAAIPFGIRELGRRLSALGVGGRPEDVAEAIVFLASPCGQGMTGQTLRVCGGSLLGA